MGPSVHSLTIFHTFFKESAVVGVADTGTEGVIHASRHNIRTVSQQVISNRLHGDSAAHQPEDSFAYDNWAYQDC